MSPTTLNWVLKFLEQQGHKNYLSVPIKIQNVYSKL